MKIKWLRLFAVISLIAAIGVSAPVYSAQKKAAAKVKTGAVCSKPAPAKSVKKSTTKKNASKAKAKATKKHAAKKSATKKKTIKAKPAASVSKALPRLLDLGATKCVPCKMMVPVLDDLSKEYKGKLKVDFIDVWKDQSAGEKYNVQSIPTQIFFDAKGKEVYRHVGYFPKADILKAFKDHGIKLTK
ncbi:MAG: thioredoxin family protein [Armatimonadota bacterium]|nr:thioredoxin family protein [bacterium]